MRSIGVLLRTAAVGRLCSPDGRGVAECAALPNQDLTESNKFGVWFTTAPSIASIFSLVTTPPLAEKPPGLPPAASTRWQGTTIGQGLRPSAWPTSRDSSTPPSRLAISP